LNGSSRRSVRAGEGDDAPLARLSRPPTRRWPDGAWHHGSRAGLLLLLALVVSFLFPADPGLDVTRYQVGMVASEDVIASVTFGVPKSPEELQREREEAARAVPPTFRFRPDAAEAMVASLETFFDNVQAAAGSQGASDELGRLLSDLGIGASAPQRALLLDASVRRTLETAAFRAAREILPEGVLDEAARHEPAAAGRIVVVDPDGAERYMARDSVLSAATFYERAGGLLPASASPQLHDLLRLTLIRFMNPTLRYDAEASESDRDAARRAVPTSRATVLQGEAVVRANQQVGETEVERLQAYEEELRARGQLQERGFEFSVFAGSVFLNLLILAVYGFLLYLFRKDVYHNFRWVLLQAALVTAFMASAGIVAANALPPEVLPIAFVALAVAVLWDGRLALILAGTLAVLIGVQAPFQSVHAWTPVFVGGAAAALSVRAVRRRAQTWIFIAIIAAAYVATIASLGVVTGRAAPSVMVAIVWAGGNAVVSAILAMGFLPVFEWFTRITTDQTLLEWADPNRPLLKRLSMEAPGTYAHTINVANLSEAAANAIGANGLLCRVGVYYHDVGKMLKPQYFIENQPGGKNPHDKLKPETSASIVREHVTEGMRLGREANLPDVLLDFIPEHHGTQEISYFLNRAREEAGDDRDQPDAEEYRYPGPRPRSRETAIVMLADSVESATRTLQEPTPERVRDLIESIVDQKIAANQLDEAPLTLQDIGTIKDQFQKVLAGLYHHRIDYPETRHLTTAPGGGGKVDPAGTATAGADDPDPDDPGRGRARGEDAKADASGASSSAGKEPVLHRADGPDVEAGRRPGAGDGSGRGDV
jgi:cyclic-di-AMP phosphodiesterase PgpH